MNSPTVAHWLVLAVVAVAQAILFRKAFLLARQDDGPGLAGLGGTFTADIRMRAQRGQAPDWLRYQAETDRLFELRDDRLRSLAAAALAIGLGGTLLALYVSIPRGSAGFRPEILVQSMGVSLLGSLSGVIVNLLIVLHFLPTAEGRFSAQTRDFLRKLQEVSDQHLPQEAFTQTLREELTLIRQALNTEFAAAFSTAITGFPQVVAELGVHIDKLAGVVQGQGKSIDGAVTDLAQCATTVADSSSRLQPAAEKLAESTSMLANLPQELQAVVGETRNGWIAGMREQHEQHVRQLIDLQERVEETSRVRQQEVLDATRELRLAVAEVRDAVGRIPEHLVAAVTQSAGRLGIEFGREARDHTNQLTEYMAGEHEKLLRCLSDHEQEWRNSIGSMVHEVFQQFAGTIQEHLVEQLEKVTRDLDNVVRILPEAAQEIATSSAELSRAQREALEGWKSVGKSTKDASRKLIEADGHLNVTVEALRKSAGHLEKVAHVTEGFEGAVLASHRQAVADYMTGLDSLREDLLALVQKINDRHIQFDGTLERQSDFIRTCIQQLMKGRQLATLETPG